MDGCWSLWCCVCWLCCMQDLAEMVVDALQQPTISVTEACALNNLDIDTDKFKASAAALLPNPHLRRFRLAHVV